MTITAFLLPKTWITSYFICNILTPVRLYLLNGAQSILSKYILSDLAKDSYGLLYGHASINTNDNIITLVTVNFIKSINNIIKDVLHEEFCPYTNPLNPSPLAFVCNLVMIYNSSFNVVLVGYDAIHHPDIIFVTFIYALFYYKEKEKKKNSVKNISKIFGFVRRQNIFSLICLYCSSYFEFSLQSKNGWHTSIRYRLLIY